MFYKILICAGLHRLCALIPSICMLLSSSVCSAHEEGEAGTQGSPPKTLFSELLPDVPGKRLTVVALTYPPKSDRKPLVHRHPGSVYVYVTKGTARWAIEGEPVTILHQGDGFFEPPGVLHTVQGSASTTEPVSVIAVMIVPDGAPLLTVE